MFCPYRRQFPPLTIPYIVKPGDTFCNFSNRFTTSAEAFRSVNPQIDPSRLPISQQAYIPMPRQYPSCPEGNHHIVKPGDTLYSIARFFNISADELIENNPYIDPDNILTGQVICIPVDTTPVICPPGSISYAVQKDDTYYSISQNFNITIAALSKANPSINPDALLIGQNICIPRPWSIYSNSEYNITFMYPLRWRRIDDERYEGVDGFFQVSAISSPAPIDDICKNEAYHKLKPYGSQPAINSLTVQGQEACYIFPSQDQPPEMKEQSALIVTYPKPVLISGETYNYFILWGDKKHIKEIVKSLNFLVD